MAISNASAKFTVNFEGNFQQLNQGLNAVNQGLTTAQSTAQGVADELKDVSSVLRATDQIARQVDVSAPIDINNGEDTGNDYLYHIDNTLGKMQQLTTRIDTIRSTLGDFGNGFAQAIGKYYDFSARGVNQILNPVSKTIRDSRVGTRESGLQSFLKDQANLKHTEGMGQLIGRFNLEYENYFRNQGMSTYENPFKYITRDDSEFKKYLSQFIAARRIDQKDIRYKQIDEDAVIKTIIQDLVRRRTSNIADSLQNIDGRRAFISSHDTSANIEDINKALGLIYKQDTNGTYSYTNEAADKVFLEKYNSVAGAAREILRRDISGVGTNATSEAQGAYLAKNESFRRIMSKLMPGVKLEDSDLERYAHASVLLSNPSSYRTDHTISYKENRNGQTYVQPPEDAKEAIERVPERFRNAYLKFGKTDTESNLDPNNYLYSFGQAFSYRDLRKLAQAEGNEKLLDLMQQAKIAKMYDGRIHFLDENQISKNQMNQLAGLALREYGYAEKGSPIWDKNFMTTIRDSAVGLQIEPLLEMLDKDATITPFINDDFMKIKPFGKRKLEEIKFTRDNYSLRGREIKQQTYPDSFVIPKTTIDEKGNLIYRDPSEAKKVYEKEGDEREKDEDKFVTINSSMITRLLGMNGNNTFGEGRENNGNAHYDTPKIIKVQTKGNYEQNKEAYTRLFNEGGMYGDKQYVQGWVNDDNVYFVEKTQYDNVVKMFEDAGMPNPFEGGNARSIMNAPEDKRIKQLNAVRKFATPSRTLQDYGYYEEPKIAAVDYSRMYELYNSLYDETNPAMKAIGRITKESGGMLDSPALIRTEYAPGNFQGRLGNIGKFGAHRLDWEKLFSAETGIIQQKDIEGKNQLIQGLPIKMDARGIPINHNASYLGYTNTKGEHIDLAYYMPRVGIDDSSVQSRLEKLGIHFDKKRLNSMGLEQSRIDDILNQKDSVTMNDVLIGLTNGAFTKRGEFDKIKDEYLVDVLDKDYGMLMMDSSIKNIDMFSKLTVDQYNKMFNSGEKAKPVTQEELEKQGRLDAKGLVNLNSKEQQHYIDEYNKLWGGLGVVRTGEGFSTEKRFMSHQAAIAAGYSQEVIDKSNDRYTELLKNYDDVNWLRQHAFDKNGYLGRKLAEDPNFIYSEQAKAAIEKQKQGIIQKRDAHVLLMPEDAEGFNGMAMPMPGSYFEFLGAMQGNSVNKNSNYAAAFPSFVKEAISNNGGKLSDSIVNGFVAPQFKNWHGLGFRMPAAFSTFVEGLNLYYKNNGGKIEEDKTFSDAYKLLNQDMSSIYLTPDALYKMNTGDYDGDTVWLFGDIMDGLIEDIQTRDNNYTEETKGNEKIDKNVQAAKDRRAQLSDLQTRMKARTDEIYKEKKPDQIEIPQNMGELTYKAIGTYTRSQQGMGLGQAALDAALLLDDSDPRKWDAILDAMEYYDFATSEIRTQGLDKQMGKAGAAVLFQQGRTFDKWVREVGGRTDESPELEHSAFQARMGNINSPQTISNILMFQKSRKNGLYDFSLDDKAKRAVRYMYNPDSVKGQAAEWYTQLMLDTETGRHFATESDIAQGYTWIKQMNEEMATRKMQGASTAELEQYQKDINYLQNSLTQMGGSQENVITQRSLEKMRDYRGKDEAELAKAKVAEAMLSGTETEDEQIVRSIEMEQNEKLAQRLQQSRDMLGQQTKHMVTENLWQKGKYSVTALEPWLQSKKVRFSKGNISNAATVFGNNNSSESILDFDTYHDDYKQKQEAAELVPGAVEEYENTASIQLGKTLHNELEKISKNGVTGITDTRGYLMNVIQQDLSKFDKDITVSTNDNGAMIVKRTDGSTIDRHVIDNLQTKINNLFGQTDFTNGQLSAGTGLTSIERINEFLKRYDTLGEEGKMRDDSGNLPDLYSIIEDGGISKMIGPHFDKLVRDKDSGKLWMIDYKSRQKGVQQSLVQMQEYFNVLSSYADTYANNQEGHPELKSVYDLFYDEQGNKKKMEDVIGGAVGIDLFTGDTATWNYNQEDLDQTKKDFEAAARRKKTSAEEGGIYGIQFLQRNGILNSAADVATNRRKQAGENFITQNPLVLGNNAAVQFYTQGFYKDEETLDSLRSEIFKEENRQNNISYMSGDKFRKMAQEAQGLFSPEMYASMREQFKGDQAIQDQIDERMKQQTEAIQKVEELRINYAKGGFGDSIEGIRKQVYGTKSNGEFSSLSSMAAAYNKEMSTLEGLKTINGAYDIIQGKWRTDEVIPEGMSMDDQNIERARALRASEAEEAYNEGQTNLDELTSYIQQASSYVAQKSNRKSIKDELERFLDPSKQKDPNTIIDEYEDKIRDSIIQRLEQYNTDIHELQKLLDSTDQSGKYIVTGEARATIEQKINETKEAKDQLLGQDQNKIVDNIAFSELERKYRPTNNYTQVSKNYDIDKQMIQNKINEEQKAIETQEKLKKQIAVIDEEINGSYYEEDVDNGYFQALENNRNDLQRQLNENGTGHEDNLKRYRELQDKVDNKSKLELNSIVAKNRQSMDQYSLFTDDSTRIDAMKKEYAKNLQAKKDDILTNFAAYGFQNTEDAQNYINKNFMSEDEYNKRIEESIGLSRDKNNLDTIRTAYQAMGYKEYSSEYENADALSRKNRYDTIRQNLENQLASEGFRVENGQAIYAREGSEPSEVQKAKAKAYEAFASEKGRSDFAINDISSRYGFGSSLKMYNRKQEDINAINHWMEGLDNSSPEYSRLSQLKDSINSSYNLYEEQENLQIQQQLNRVNNMSLQRRAPYAQALLGRTGGMIYQNLQRNTQELEQRKSLDISMRKQATEKNNTLKTLYVNGDTNGQLIHAEDAAKANDLKNQLNTLNTSIQQNANSMKSLKGASSVLGASFSAMAQTVGNLAQRFLSMNIRKIFNEAKQAVLQFNSALVQIQTITMKTDSAMEDVGDSITSKAKELKTSISNVAQVESDLYRQGLSDEEVSVNTDAIIKFSTVSGTKVTEATKAITVALKNDLVSSAEEAMDALTALGDNAATTADQIFKAMQKCANSASEAGVSYAELTSLITLAESETQISGSQVGTAFQSIFTRMTKISAGDEAVEANGEVTSVNDVEKALNSAGVALRSDNSTFRDTFDILVDLSKVWSELSDIQKSAITSSIAGTRQANVFSTLMDAMGEDDGATLEKYLDLAENSDGITQSKYEIAVSGITGAVNELKATFDSLVISFTDNNIITGAIDMLTNIVSGLQGFVDVVGPFKAAMTAIGVALLAFAVKACTAAAMSTGGLSLIGTVLGGAAAIGITATALGSGNNYNEQQAAAKGLTQEDITERRTNLNSNMEQAFGDNDEAIESMNTVLDKYEEGVDEMTDADIQSIVDSINSLGGAFDDIKENIDGSNKSLNDWKNTVSDVEDKNTQLKQSMYNQYTEENKSAIKVLGNKIDDTNDLSGIFTYGQADSTYSETGTNETSGNQLSGNPLNVPNLTELNAPTINGIMESMDLLYHMYSGTETSTMSKEDVENAKEFLNNYITGYLMQDIVNGEDGSIFQYYDQNGELQDFKYGSLFTMLGSGSVDSQGILNYLFEDILQFDELNGEKGYSNMLDVYSAAASGDFNLFGVNDEQKYGISTSSLRTAYALLILASNQFQEGSAMSENGEVIAGEAKDSYKDSFINDIFPNEARLVNEYADGDELLIQRIAERYVEEHPYEDYVDARGNFMTSQAIDDYTAFLDSIYAEDWGDYELQEEYLKEEDYGYKINVGDENNEEEMLLTSDDYKDFVKKYKAKHDGNAPSLSEADFNRNVKYSSSDMNVNRDASDVIKNLDLSTDDSNYLEVTRDISNAMAKGSPKEGKTALDYYLKSNNAQIEYALQQKYPDLGKMIKSWVNSETNGAPYSYTSDDIDNFIYKQLLGNSIYDTMSSQTTSRNKYAQANNVLEGVMAGDYTDISSMISTLGITEAQYYADSDRYDAMYSEYVDSMREDLRKEYQDNLDTLIGDSWMTGATEEEKANNMTISSIEDLEALDLNDKTKEILQNQLENGAILTRYWDETSQSMKIAVELGDTITEYAEENPLKDYSTSYLNTQLAIDSSKILSNFKDTGDLEAATAGLSDEELEKIKSYSSELSEYLHLTEEQRESQYGQNLEMKINVQILTEGLDDLEYAQKIMSGTTDELEAMAKGGLEAANAINSLGAQFETATKAIEAYNTLKAGGKISSEQAQNIKSYFGLNDTQFEGVLNGTYDIDNQVQYAEEQVENTKTAAISVLNSTSPSEVLSSSEIVLPSQNVGVAINRIIPAPTIYPEQFKEYEGGIEKARTAYDALISEQDYNKEYIDFYNRMKNGEKADNIIKEWEANGNDTQKSIATTLSDTNGDYIKIDNENGRLEYIYNKTGMGTYNSGLSETMQDTKMTEVLNAMLSGNTSWIQNATNNGDYDTVFSYLSKMIPDFETLLQYLEQGIELEEYQKTQLEAGIAYAEMLEKENNKEVESGTASNIQTLISGTYDEQQNVISGYQSRLSQASQMQTILNSAKKSGSFTQAQKQTIADYLGKDSEWVKEIGDNFEEVEAQLKKKSEPLNESLEAILLDFNITDMDQLKRKAENGHDTILSLIYEMLTLSDSELEDGKITTKGSSVTAGGIYNELEASGGYSTEQRKAQINLDVNSAIKSGKTVEEQAQAVISLGSEKGYTNAEIAQSLIDQKLGEVYATLFSANGQTGDSALSFLSGSEAEEDPYVSELQSSVDLSTTAINTFTSAITAAANYINDLFDLGLNISNESNNISTESSAEQYASVEPYEPYETSLRPDGTPLNPIIKNTNVPGFNKSAEDISIQDLRRVNSPNGVINYSSIDDYSDPYETRLRPDGTLYPISNPRDPTSEFNKVNQEYASTMSDATLHPDFNYELAEYEMRMAQTEAILGENWSSGEFDISLDEFNSIISTEAGEDWLKYFETLDGGTQVLSDFENGVESSKENLEALRVATVKAELSAKDLNGTQTESIETYEKLSGSESDRAEAMEEMLEENDKLAQRQYWRDEWYSGDRSDETYEGIADQLGASNGETVKDWQSDGIDITKLLKIQEAGDIGDMDTMVDSIGYVIQDLMNQAVQDGIITTAEIPANITITDGVIDADTSAILNKINPVWAGMITELFKLMSFNGTIETTVDGDKVELGLAGNNVDSYSGKNYTPKSSGGGGSGKTKTDKIIANYERAQKPIDHKIKQLETQEEIYDADYEYTNEIAMKEEEIEANKEKKELLGNKITALQNRLDSGKVKENSKEWQTLTDALREAHEEYSEVDKSLKTLEKDIEELNKKKLELQVSAQDTYMKDLEDAEAFEEEKLAGRISMEEAVLNVLKEQYQEEADLRKKDLENQKEALQEEMDLIDEKLQMRKDAQDESEKLEELAELKRQRALIAADPTRSKDVAELDEKIAEKEKDLYWDEAEDIANAEKEVLQDEQDGIDDMIEEIDEETEKVLENTRYFADQVEDILSGTSDDIIDFLKENDSSYLNSLDSTREQMVEGWGDTYNKMMGITSKYTTAVNKMIKGEELTEEDIDTMIEAMYGTSEYKNATDAEKEQMEQERRETYANYNSSTKSTVDTDNTLDWREFLAQKYNDDGIVYSKLSKAEKAALKDEFRGIENANYESVYEEGLDLSIKNNSNKQDELIKFLNNVGYDVDAKKSVSVTNRQSNVNAKSLESLNKLIGKNSNLRLYDATSYALLYGIANNKDNEDSSDTKIARIYKLLNNGTSIPQYKKGGLVDFTGLTWVDGSLTQPEAFLSAEDTQTIRSMLDAANSFSFKTYISDVSDNLKSGVQQTIGDVTININEASISDDMDIQKLAEQVGNAFVKELSKQGISTANYSF